MKTKFQSAFFSPLGRLTGTNFLFKGGLTGISPAAPQNSVIKVDKCKEKLYKYMENNKMGWKIK